MNPYRLAPQPAPARPRWLVVLALAGFCLALLPASQCGTTAVATVPSDVALVQCVLATYSTDEAAGMTAAAIAADELAKCGSDAATIASIVDAHEAANAKEGVSAPANPGAVSAALKAHDAGH
jgi:hypothetical protein